jgi:hypothetical protein
MFDETLDVYPHKKVNFDIDPNAKSVHPMPHLVRGCTGEFPATKSKKLFQAPRTQKKEEKERTRNERTTSQTLRAPSPNCRFSISKH